MNVLGFYADRMEDIKFRDKTEKCLLLRRGKSMSPKTIADGKVIVTENSTDIQNGEIIERSATGEKFVIIAKQHSSDCTQMQGRRINGSIDVVKFVDSYVNHKKVGVTTQVVASAVPTYFEDINAAMRQYDAGLLQTTVKKFIIQPSIPVELLDRIVLNGRNYKVTNIDTAKYVDLLDVQVSEDNRK